MFNRLFGKNGTNGQFANGTEKNGSGYPGSTERSESFKWILGPMQLVTERYGRKSASFNPPPFEQIYQTAAVKPPKLSYGCLKVVEMAGSTHLAGMTPEFKRKALLMALEATGTGVSDVLNDVVAVRMEIVFGATPADHGARRRLLNFHGVHWCTSQEKKRAAFKRPGICPTDWPGLENGSAPAQLTPQFVGDGTGRLPAGAPALNLHVDVTDVGDVAAHTMVGRLGPGVHRRKLAGKAASRRSRHDHFTRTEHRRDGVRALRASTPGKIHHAAVGLGHRRVSHT